MKSLASISPAVNKDPWVHFQPGQMIYVIKHPNDSPPQAQLEELFSWSNRLSESRGLYVIPVKKPAEGEGQEEDKKEWNGKGNKEAQEGPKILKEHEHRRPRVHSFSPKPGINLLPKKQIEHKEGVKYESPAVQTPPPFSLISVDVIDRNDSDKFVENARLVGLINHLDDNLRGLVDNSVKPSLSSGVSLEAVLPNWLMSASSESGGTGGPGARPVPFTYIPGQTATPEPDVLDFPFNVSQNFMALPGLHSEKSERGKGVKVAILDTAPGFHELAAAYERWQKVNPALRCKVRHKSIETLLGPNGPLTVHHASYNDLLRMRSVHLHEHNYKMTDHGLFVASIIHNIAPAAEIHLFEVLNADGVGDLESIAKGLWEVYDQFAGQLLVVNCSLVINIPLAGDQITGLDPEILKKIVKNWETRETKPTDYLDVKPGELDLAWLERQAEAIRWICDLLYSHGSKVIAAAGNDGRENGGRPNARYPAAFDSVLGVGALPKDTVWGTLPYTPATYSNISDEPGDVGVTTFGGEGGEGKGVLGLYIGEFPVDPNPSWWQKFLNWLITLLGGRVAGPRNLTDMAWWAGTSFATPILTGTVAAVLSDIQPARTEDAIEEAYHKLLIKENQTVQEEDAIDVTQP